MDARRTLREMKLLRYLRCAPQCGIAQQCALGLSAVQGRAMCRGSTGRYSSSGRAAGWAWERMEAPSKWERKGVGQQGCTPGMRWHAAEAGMRGTGVARQQAALQCLRVTSISQPGSTHPSSAHFVLPLPVSPSAAHLLVPAADLPTFLLPLLPACLPYPAHSHENVIAVRDIMRPACQEYNDVYIVYELMDTDLHQAGVAQWGWLGRASGWEGWSSAGGVSERESVAGNADELQSKVPAVDAAWQCTHSMPSPHQLPNPSLPLKLAPAPADHPVQPTTQRRPLPVLHLPGWMGAEHAHRGGAAMRTHKGRRECNSYAPLLPRCCSLPTKPGSCSVARLPALHRFCGASSTSTPHLCCTATSSPPTCCSTPPAT